MLPFYLMVWGFFSLWTFCFHTEAVGQFQKPVMLLLKQKVMKHKYKHAPVQMFWKSVVDIKITLTMYYKNDEGEPQRQSYKSEHQSDDLIENNYPLQKTEEGVDSPVIILVLFLTLISLLNSDFVHC